MLRSRIDRAFRRYQQTGDARSLARVFDATAPELYRLAFHLAGDRHAAEDLVQTTFLTAIEDVASYDGTRRVLPWLLGILANRARHDRRQARQRERTPPIARASLPGDPLALAAAGELNATVAAAVRALPDPYRQVVLLHVLHELSPKQVAEALARPDATVRTQLHRGLDLLRKLLPASLAGVAFGCAPPPLGLGTVRAAVLAAAARHGTVAAGVGAATFGGLLAMKKVLSVLGAVLALVFACWPSPEPPPHAAVPRAGLAVNAAAAGDAPAARAEPDATVREAVPLAPQDARAGLVVLARWSDGTPATDVSVRCKPVRPDGDLWLRVARTDDGGFAHFTGLWPGTATAAVDRGGKAEVELSPGATQHLTLDIPRGFDVNGHVLDANDRPIAGAAVWLSVAAATDESEVVATAAPDGSFTVRSAGPGQVLAATAPGHGSARVVIVSAKLEHEPCVLRVRAAPGVLVGTVIDAQGQAIADARVLVGAWLFDGDDGTSRRLTGEMLYQDTWPAHFLRTDAAGSFRVEGLPPLRWPLWVAAPGRGPCHRIVEVLSLGETHVTVQLGDGARITGRATGAAGAPLAGVRIVASPVLPPASREIDLGMANEPLWTRRTARTGDDGEYTLEHVMAGELRLLAQHERLSVHEVLRVADGATVAWSPRLEEPLRLRLLLVDERGGPLPGWLVRCENAATGAYVNTFVTNAAGEIESPAVADGDYRLFAGAGPPALAPELAVGTVHAGAAPVRIVVPHESVPTAALCGTVLGPDGTASAHTVLHIERVTTGDFATVQVDAEGRFRSPALQPGRYRVVVADLSFGAQTLGEGDAPADGVADLGVLRIPAPGRLEVTVVDSNGRVLPEPWLVAHPIEQGEPTVALRHREGRVHGNLRAGRYVLATHAPAPIAAQQVDVRSGETTVVRFVVPDGVPFVLRVPAAAREQRELSQVWRDAQGAMVRRAAIESSDAGKDVDGNAPPGRYTLEVTSGDGRTATTAVELRAADPPMVIGLPLPAAR
ncbi:MAG TPA: sigma-70 family RNA polymerase sigma factor [Planctomycetota bacterium]|nr:sigma-70 family RNA polymerase sigma factor [Planctomycetota bacterium]